MVKDKLNPLVDNSQKCPSNDLDMTNYFDILFEYSILCKNLNGDIIFLFNWLSFNKISFDSFNIVKSRCKRYNRTYLLYQINSSLLKYEGI
jgi:hypothetical protein